MQPIKEKYCVFSVFFFIFFLMKEYIRKGKCNVYSAKANLPPGTKTRVLKAEGGVSQFAEDLIKTWKDLTKVEGQ